MKYTTFKYIVVHIVRRPILFFKGLKLLFFEGITGVERKIKLERSKEALKNRNSQIHDSATPPYFYNKVLNQKIDHGTKTLPISVIITTIKSRSRFLEEFVFPSVKANNPAEILVIDDINLNVQEKRNKGITKAHHPYLFFCDDDIILSKNHLKILYYYLNNRPDIGYVYTDYCAIVIDSTTHPQKPNYYHKSIKFNAAHLKYDNYISTMTLIRKECFHECEFDSTIKRFQDWDLWLTLLNKGIIGEYVEETGFFAFYLDDGITSEKNDIKKARDIILKKHNIPK